MSGTNQGARRRRARARRQELWARLNEPGRLDEGRERRLLLASSLAVLLMVAGPARLSPDGLEMLALTAGWTGRGGLPDSGYWPPLWPALLMLAGETAERGAWWLNLLCAAAVVGPLHRLGCRLGSRGAGRGLVLIWLLLPAVREHAVVLDARPLGWWLSASALAWAVEGSLGERRWPGWGLALAFAALAPLARPEGILLVPLLTVGGLLVLGWRALPLGALATVPHLLNRTLRGGGRGQWESFWVPWSDTWPVADFLALTGAASSPSGYRRFLLAAVEAGVEKPPSDPLALLNTLPQGLLFVFGGLSSGLGLLLCGAALVGAALLARRSLRGVWVLGLGLLPIFALAALPMTQGQSTTTANLVFLLPALLALVALPLSRLGPAGLALVLLGGLEANLSPLRQPAPFFLEDSEAARRLTLWLQTNPPADGGVWCTISGRGVVLRAGWTPQQLPSLWEAWQPDSGARVLLSMADFHGEDGGRGLSLLESPDWRLLRSAAEPMASSAPAEAEAWFVLLEHR